MNRPKKPWSKNAIRRKHFMLKLVIKPHKHDIEPDVATPTESENNRKKRPWFRRTPVKTEQPHLPQKQSEK